MESGSRSRARTISSDRPVLHAEGGDEHMTLTQLSAYSKLSEQRLLTPAQAATYLGLPSRWSIYRLVRGGALPGLALAGKLRLDRQDLDRLIEAKKADAASRTPAAAMIRPATRLARARLSPLAPRRRLTVTER